MAIRYVDIGPEDGKAKPVKAAAPKPAPAAAPAEAAEEAPAAPAAKPKRRKK